MIEILHQYWQALLWSDGYRFTGMAVTLWLLISSVVMGVTGNSVGSCAGSRAALDSLTGMDLYLYLSWYAVICAITDILFWNVQLGDSPR